MATKTVAGMPVSIQRLLGKEDQFFDLLEASAIEARTCVQAFKKFVQNPQQLGSLDEFAQSRRKDKAITSQINEALCTTFVTALEREDIENLSNALYKIPKTVEKIAERIQLAPHFFQGIDLSPQIAMVEQATGVVLAMIQHLRKGSNLVLMRGLNEHLQQVEGEMDKQLLELLRELYSEKIAGSGRVVFLKDIYEMLERVTDRCRDAGNVITHIVLKNG